MIKKPDYFFEKAVKHHDLANHLFKVTFPLAKDPKLLLGIAKEIFFSLESAMDALLYLEQKEKLISNFPYSFRGKQNIFLHELANKFNFPKNQINLLNDLNQLIELYKKSSVVFKRRGFLVICKDDYEIKLVGIRDIKNFIEINRNFLINVKKIITSTNNKIYNRK